MIKIKELDNKRFLLMNGVYQSVCGLNEDDDIIFNYMHFFDIYAKDAKHMLLLGGGGYTYPRHVLRCFSCLIDVVENNEEMTTIAQTSFFLKEHERLTIIHDDLHHYLYTTTQKYDLIINDAFKGYNPVYTDMKIVKKVLTDDGIYLQNIFGCPKIQHIGGNSVLIWNKNNRESF